MYGRVLGGTLEVDDASTKGDRHCLRAVVDLKLGKNISHVHLYRVFRDRELAGDFFVSLSGCHERQHIELARADRLVSHVLGQLLGDRSGKAPLPRVNAADGFEQFVTNDPFCDISLRSRFKRTLFQAFPLLSRSTVWTLRAFFGIPVRLNVCPSFTGRLNPSALVIQMVSLASSLSQNLPLPTFRSRPSGSPGSRRAAPLSVLNQIEPLLCWSNPDKKDPGSVIAAPICS